VVDIPTEYGAYRCAEYFDDYQEGRYDAKSYHWFIYSVRNVEISLDHLSLVIGDAGTDGISFCYRPNVDGIWAFYPIERRWERVAQTLHEFEAGWLSGTIVV